MHQIFIFRLQINIVFWGRDISINTEALSHLRVLTLLVVSEVALRWHAWRPSGLAFPAAAVASDAALLRQLQRMSALAFPAAAGAA